MAAITRMLLSNRLTPKQLETPMGPLPQRADALVALAAHAWRQLARREHLLMRDATRKRHSVSFYQLPLAVKQALVEIAEVCAAHEGRGDEFLPDLWAWVTIHSTRLFAARGCQIKRLRFENLTAAQRSALAEIAEAMHRHWAASRHRRVAAAQRRDQSADLKAAA